MMRRVLLVLLGVLVFAALPSQAEAGGRSGHHGHGGHGGHSYRGGHGYYGGHSYRGGHRYRYGGHGYRHGGYYSFWLAPLLWGPGWYPAYAYPYRQPTRVVVEERVVYVERPPSAAPAENWWYYCESAGDYYPDVASCPESWVKVAPRPESRRSPL